MTTPQKVSKIEISPKTIFITILMLVGFFFVWELRSVIFLFFIAYIINAAFRPLIDWLESKRVPRMLSIVIVYIISFGIIGLFLATIFTEAFTQLTNLISQIPNIVYNILTNLNNSLPEQFNFLNAAVIKENLGEIVSSLLKMDSSVFTVSISSALGVISYAATATVIISMIVILSIYLLERKQDISTMFTKYISKGSRQKYSNLFKRIEVKLGMWLRAQVVLMLSAASIIWIGLTIPVLFIPGYSLHNYALPIAMLVALLEIVPGTGIAVGGVLSTLVALATGNIFLIIYTPLLFILTQQVESMFISPKVMKKAIGLDPVITILAFLIGYTLFQVAGAVLIIPMLAVIQIVLEFKAEELETEKNNKKN